MSPSSKHKREKKVGRKTLRTGVRQMDAAIKAKTLKGLKRGTDSETGAGYTHRREKKKWFTQKETLGRGHQ